MKLHKSSCTFFAATALALAGCGDSDSTTYTNPVPDLLITMGEQSRKASGAKGSADMSLKDATTKASMLSAVKVKGESSVAEANAKAILDAQTKVRQALDDANAALKALEGARTEADALPADTPKLEELKAELATAITEAARHRDAIKALKDATATGSITKLAEKVTGVNGKGTPADIAAAVAVEVEKAMVFIAEDGTYPKITGGVTPNQDGKDGVRGMRDSFVSRFANPKVQEYNGRNVQDFPGVRIHQTDYANYGYWLAIPSQSNEIAQISIFGFPKSSTLSIPSAAITTPNIDGDMGKATYTGSALGLSVLTARDGRNRKAIKSGEFTADVKLTATFKAEPKVEGTINRFKGNAVNPDWNVELTEADLQVTVPTFPSSYAATRVKDAPNGLWSARAGAGTATKRPMSISGELRIFFPDGRAAGGYAVVKDD